MLRCLLSWISFGVIVVVLIGMIVDSFLKEKYIGYRIIKREMKFDATYSDGKAAF